MVSSTVLLCTQGSTSDVPACERMAYWEALCSTTLVGLRCSSLSPGGLEVEKTGIAMPGLGIADIRGQDHVIERNPALVRQMPKESVFACQLLQGRAYFIQRDRCLLAEAGDIVVYDTRIPYLFGFLTPMRQLLIDVPIATLDNRLESGLDQLPLKIAPRAGSGAMLGKTLHAPSSVLWVIRWTPKSRGSASTRAHCSHQSSKWNCMARVRRAPHSRTC